MTLPMLFSRTHSAPCVVIETRALWGRDVCRIWLPERDATALVAREDLVPLDAAAASEAPHIVWAATAARVAEALEDEQRRALLAPLQVHVTPLPHQLHALQRAMTHDPVRCLLADEVGLGKTIEAGLVLRELKMRGRAARALVVAPKSLAQQWVSEMRTHFGEEFRLVQGEDIAALARTAPDASPWRMFDQVVVTLDAVKPVERRRGWSDAQLAAYNRARFDDLIEAGWDLVIFDEAHRLGGSSDAVARHRLGRALADAAPHLLLLSATPHQGKSDAFLRLMRLLDEEAFPDEETVTRERVRPYVVRTEKRRALDADGRPLFKPRRTEYVAVEWQGRHERQRVLYEAVTDYVRRGYDLAQRRRDGPAGFLMILMQRLVASSTRAIRSTIERRLQALDRQSDRLEAGSEQGLLFAEQSVADDDAYDLDGQSLLECTIDARTADLRSERAEVTALAAAAAACEAQCPDARAEALYERILQLQSEEGDADLKVLLFTEFVPTQQMLREFLEARGMRVATLNGAMDMDERRRAQEEFRGPARVLVSTDAGGEGLNLQFCHVVVNYDLPWNPMRLEQRIGRVDRIGQPRVVRAINLALRDTVEHRVREVLEEKLAVILREFGVDKTGDVLDSAQAGALFEGVFTEVLQTPERIEAAVEHGVQRLADEFAAARAASPLEGLSDAPDAAAARDLRSDPLPAWIERAAMHWLRSHGGRAVPERSGAWLVRWPGASDAVDEHVAFSGEPPSGVALLTLQDARVRAALEPRAAAAAVPHVRLAGASFRVDGAWGLFEIRAHGAARAFLPVYVDAHGRSFPRTAQRLWDHWLTRDGVVLAVLAADEASAVRATLTAAAEREGEAAYAALVARVDAARLRDDERAQSRFAARRRAIMRHGLPEVRAHRLARLEEDEVRQRTAMAPPPLPELRPLLWMRVEAGEAP